jgi:hypothetical protein
VNLNSGYNKKMTSNIRAQTTSFSKVALVFVYLKRGSTIELLQQHGTILLLTSFCYMPSITLEKEIIIITA